jgi:hypothetical protein
MVSDLDGVLRKAAEHHETNGLLRGIGLGIGVGDIAAVVHSVECAADVETA